MVKKFKVTYVKGMIGALLVALFILAGTDNVKASTDNNLSETTITLTEEGEKVDLDMSKVISSLQGKNLYGGEIIYDGDFKIVTEVTINPEVSSGISIMSVTNSYSASCNVFVYVNSSNRLLGVITHTVSITHNDSGLVHINSGTLSVYMNLSTWTGTVTVYEINNTDGSYSGAGGMVEFYDSSRSSYFYYLASVKVYRGNSPSFSFTQV